MLPPRTSGKTCDDAPADQLGATLLAGCRLARRRSGRLAGGAIADDLLSYERSSAASWRPATCHKNRRGYGRWLTFLKNSSADLSVPLADRVTREHVAAYLEELRRQQVAPYTLRNRILELHAVMSP